MTDPLPLDADITLTSDTRHVLVVLHGHGDTPGALVEAVEPLLGEGFGLVVPTGPTAAADGPAWFPSVSGDVGPGLDRALDSLAELCTRAIDDFGLDERSMTVLAYSQGAATALALACRRTSGWRPSSIIGIAAWLPAEPDVSWDFDAAARHRVEVLLVHGVEDGVVPVAEGRSAARVLTRHGIAVDVVEHPNGHELASTPLGAIHDRLAAQQRDQ
jgi:phospholipase/carboxylesterase